MNLLNQTLEGLESIFEANLINIILFDVGLVYFLCGRLCGSLAERERQLLAKLQRWSRLFQDVNLALESSTSRLEYLNAADAKLAVWFTDLQVTYSSDLYKRGQENIERMKAMSENRIEIMEGRVRKRIYSYVCREILDCIRLNYKCQLLPKKEIKFDPRIIYDPAASLRLTWSERVEYNKMFKQHIIFLSTMNYFSPLLNRALNY